MADLALHGNGVWGLFLFFCCVFGKVVLLLGRASSHSSLYFWWRATGGSTEVHDTLSGSSEHSLVDGSGRFYYLLRSVLWWARRRIVVRCRIAVVLALSRSKNNPAFVLFHRLVSSPTLQTIARPSFGDFYKPP